MSSASSVNLRAWLPFAIIAAGWCAMFVPAYLGLANTIWASDAQGHGPIILAVAFWLLWQKREALLALPRQPATVTALLLAVVSVLAYIVGRSQTVWTLEIAAQNLMLPALLLFFFGWRALRLAWFPLFFLVFMIPWPGEWIDAVTQPLKMAVSTVASAVMYHLGYPVGRSGVILTVGPYQLLVADACSGLNSLFTLEALGLLYMNLMRYQSVLRNVALAILILPISFAANVIRVLILVLVTYHFGDEAGQGFIHGFAGMVLFLVALSIMLVVDKLLGLFIAEPPHGPDAATPAALAPRRTAGPGKGRMNAPGRSPARRPGPVTGGDAPAGSRRDLLRAGVMAGIMSAAAGVAWVATPRRFLADQYPREKLEQLVPTAFGDWQVDRSIVPVPPSPDLQKVLDETYDETLARTYRNPQGQRVMLSLAYGRNQHKGMNIHRPEICYPAQGFKVVRGSEPGQLDVPGRRIDVTRLVAAAGSRNEPITYWLLVGDRITRFGYPQRALVIEYGLQGIVPDGVLVRVSSISPDNTPAFALQEQFIRAMLAAGGELARRRLIGTV